MKAWTRHPAFHFLLLGVILCLGDLWMSSGDGTEPVRVLSVGPSRVEQLRGQWQAQAGRLPSAAEEDWLIRQWIDDELLFRQALELDLHRNDPGVCHRLILNMRFLGLDRSGAERQDPDRRALCRRAIKMGLHMGDPVVRRQMAGLMRIALQRSAVPQEISQQQLRDYVESHPARFREPERIRLSHVFLSRDRRAGTLEDDAQRLLRRLRQESVEPRQAVLLGDAFLAGHHLPMSWQRDLKRALGTQFASAVMDLPEKRWSGPVPSSYGLHLVWVHERLPGRLKPLQEVREQAALGVEAERAQQRLATAMQRLREQWEIRREED
ncbi:MAG TPA: peptidylprolyl isomerase [Acidobacteriota bacterium]|nr:peptidylprolyl isomerase [Acidobacteriota bacterium]